MHNLIFLDLNVWDPKYQPGNVKLMALLSWFIHEDTKLEETKIIMAKEIEEPLWIRGEQQAPHFINTNHKLIVEDRKMEYIYIEK